MSKDNVIDIKHQTVKVTYDHEGHITSVALLDARGEWREFIPKP